MSDLDRFEIFSCVAQLNSLTQSAIKLKTTKASLSKQIKKLEQDFKIDLFTRSGQRLHLTSQGQLLLEQCKRLQNELDQTRSICKQFHDEPEGVLNISIFEPFANKILLPRLDAFLKLYPKLEMVIDINEHIPNFERDNVDLAIGFALPPPNDTLIQKSMCKNRYVLCASPQYFQQHGTPQTLQDLQKHRYIAHSARIGELSLRLKPEYKLNIQPYLILNRSTSIIECARLGLGLIQPPLYMVEQLIDNGELVEVLEKYQATDINIYYYYPKFRYTQPKVRKFIDYFLA